jgi:hypothetical protein
VSGRKRPHHLGFNPAFHSVYPSVEIPGMITVILEDAGEPDRAHKLLLSPSDAVRLAARIRHLADQIEAVR